jgi:hypothetical protein
VVQSGINQAFDTWGRTLTDLSGKTRPANDADTVLNTLGYWTDNGATYYYAKASGMSYPETLAAVKSGFDGLGLPIGYMQLDSWFYPKGPTADWQNRGGGIYTYNGSPAIFEPTIAALDRKLTIPLMTHARWIDADSPYRQSFKISGNVATDPLYWDALGKFMQSSGVATYEQDWLSDQAHADFNLTDPEAFMNNMAAGTAKYGITMQYCMAQPRHFLAGSKFSNLSSIRTSEDRFDRVRWTNFLFGARLASSVGIWPFSDVFMSTEPDNLLVATLSAGPLGIGDALGAVNAANLLKAVRADGVIVKPDAPLLPLDACFLSKSAGADTPIVSTTYSDFGGGLRQNYVFAYNEGNNTIASFALADLGITGESYVYNYFTNAGAVHGASDTISEPLGNGRSYYVVSPIGGTGMAILGDLDQFVPLGKKRVSQLIDDGWAIHMTVQFAAGESQRVIQGYAPAVPAVLALAGNAQITYEPATQIFKMTVQPSSTQVARVQIAIVQ